MRCNGRILKKLPGFMQLRHKPAGIPQCSPQELDRWREDSHRFPPYQYAGRNCLVSKRGEVRLPSIEEKEVMMGFPLNYTASCSKKSARKSVETLDVRHTLVGNSWSVPVNEQLEVHVPFGTWMYGKMIRFDYII